MTLSEIVQKYGPVEVLKQLDQVVESEENINKGLIKKVDENFDIQNVFDSQFKVHSL